MKVTGVPCSLIAVTSTITSECSFGAIHYITVPALKNCLPALFLFKMWWKPCSFLPPRQRHGLGGNVQTRGFNVWCRIWKETGEPRPPSTQTVASLADQTSSQSAFSTDLKNNCHYCSLPPYCYTFIYSIAIVWFSSFLRAIEFYFLLQSWDKTECLFSEIQAQRKQFWFSSYLLSVLLIIYCVADKTYF